MVRFAIQGRVLTRQDLKLPLGEVSRWEGVTVPGLARPASLGLRMNTEPNIWQQASKEFFCRPNVPRLIGQLHDHIAQVGPRFHVVCFATGRKTEQYGRRMATPIIAQE